MTKKVKFLSLLFLLVYTFGLTACSHATVPQKPTHAQTMDVDFKMTISTSSDTFKRGKNIIAVIVFENLTEQVFEVSHARPMIVPFIVKSSDYKNIVFPIAEYSVISQYEEIIITTTMGKLLPRGKHELVAIANFTLTDSHKEIHVVSNTIILNVK